MSNTKSTSDTQECEKKQAELRLMDELAKGKRSGEEKGWLSAKEVRDHFRNKANTQ